MRQVATFAVALLLAMSACSSRQVNFDYAHEADFSSYHTFAWHLEDTSLEEENMLAHQRIVAAVEQQLTAKGLRKVDSKPDVYVTYHGEDKENMTLSTTSMGYGYGPGWGWGGFYGAGMGSTTTQVRTYTVGTLVVDIWDAAAKALVWRGIASDTISNSPQRNAQKIDDAVTDMFRRYPPPAGS